MRRLLTTISTIAVAFACFGGNAQAANFSDSSIGISIDIDDALVEQPRRMQYRFFSTADKSAAVYIIPVWDLDMYDLRQDLQDGKWKGHGMKLNIVDSELSASVSSGSGILVPFLGTLGEYRARGIFGAYEAFDDQSFLVVGAARPDYWKEWKPKLEAMFDSIQFIPQDFTAMMQDWEYRIVGMSLVPENPVSIGYLTPKPINLCSNGTVMDQKPSENQQPTTMQQTVWNGVSWVTVTVPVRPPAPTRWSLEPVRGKPTLLIFNGPFPRQFILEMDGDQLLVNGKPYRIAENKVCQ